MKKTLIFSLIAGTLFVLMALLAMADISIPNINQLREITLNSYDTGWLARLFPNGSARLVYGASFSDSANIPEGSFSFKGKYDFLIPYLKQKPNNKEECISVGLYFGDSGKGFYLEDKEVMRKIMHELCDKAVPFEKESFAHLLREYPLVPGDPPYLKAEEEEGEGEGVRSKEEVVGAETPVAAKKVGRPSLLFYVGIGVLACVGAVLFLTRKR